LAWQREVISGDPGTRWTNNTERVKYQFVCALINTCGFCLQYHMKIGAIWGIPLHRGCRCEQRRIPVGAEAPHEFVDYREILDNMSHADQVAAIGASNYKLLKDGVVKWEDIVTPSRVRDLREVVANKRLSVKTMVDAGVSPRLAATAHATVNTPEHVLAEQRQMQLVQQATASGARLEDLTKALGQKVATRVSIAAGPDTYGAGPAWTGGPITPRPPAPSQADLLLSALDKVRTRDAALAKAKAEAAKKPATPTTSESPKEPMATEPPATMPPAETKPVALRKEPPPTEETSSATTRTFASSRDADAWGTENYSKWAKGLNQSQRNAIEDYRHDAWKELNEGLRSEKGLGGLTPSLRRMAKHLDAALAKHPLPEAVTVVRSIDLKSAGIAPDQLVPGRQILDKGYTSTSLDPHKAWVGQRLEIRLPKGTPAAYVNIVGEGNKGEFELLVSRDVEQYRVVGVKDDSHRTVVLEAILPSAETKAKK
jgi:hypothetical protein